MTPQPRADVTDLREVLQSIMDAVDYTAGNCSQTQMVGAVLPKMLILNARLVLLNTKP